MLIQAFSEVVVVSPPLRYKASVVRACGTVTFFFEGL